MSEIGQLEERIKKLGDRIEKLESNVETGEGIESFVRDRDKVNQAIEGIQEGFDWEKSPQGRGYWGDVCDNLEDILNE